MFLVNWMAKLFMQQKGHLANKSRNRILNVQSVHSRPNTLQQMQETGTSRPIQGLLCHIHGRKERKSIRLSQWRFLYISQYSLELIMDQRGISPISNGFIKRQNFRVERRVRPIHEIPFLAHIFCHTDAKKRWEAIISQHWNPKREMKKEA